MAKSKSRGSLDTNVLLRLILGDVPSHTEAVDQLLAKGGEFHVADSAIIELVYVLESILHKDRSLIQENVFAIVRHKQCLANATLFDLCMPLYVAHPSLSITDCALLSYARLQKSVPLYTFDQKLVKHSEGDAKIPL